jgi:hypothetical protein
MMAVHNPVGGESYPRINGPACRAVLRINGPAFTHKRSHISFMYLYEACNRPGSPVHNADALHTVPPESLRITRARLKAVPVMF